MEGVLWNQIIRVCEGVGRNNIFNVLDIVCKFDMLQHVILDKLILNLLWLISSYRERR
jgi:hypothetical protein